MWYVRRLFWHDAIYVLLYAAKFTAFGHQVKGYISRHVAG